MTEQPVLDVRTLTILLATEAYRMSEYWACRLLHCTPAQYRRMRSEAVAMGMAEVKKEDE